MEIQKSKFEVGDWVRCRGTRCTGIITRKWERIWAMDSCNAIGIDPYGYEITLGTSRISGVEWSGE